MRYTELYEERASIDGVPVTLLRNPQVSMLMFFIEGTRRGLARGIICGADVIYWDACKASHADVQQYLGVPVTEDGFDVAEIRPDYYRVTCRQQFKQQVLANANVIRSLNDPAMHFINEDGSEVALTEGLTEGVDFKNIVQKMLDKALAVVHRKHVTYEEAIAAYDRYVEIVGEEPLWPHRDNLAVGTKEASYASGMMVSAYKIVHALTTMSSMGVGAASAAVGAAVLAAHTQYMNQKMRKDMLDSTAREERWAKDRENDAHAVQVEVDGEWHDLPDHEFQTRDEAEASITALKTEMSLDDIRNLMAKSRAGAS